MADLVPYSVIQQFLPGITDYRIKAARQHTVLHGRGVPLPTTKSPRIRVDESQLDHFLCFITIPHVVQDLPFGQDSGNTKCHQGHDTAARNRPIVQ